MINSEEMAKRIEEFHHQRQARIEEAIPKAGKQMRDIYLNGMIGKMSDAAHKVFVVLKVHYGESGGESIPSLSYVKDRTELSTNKIREAHKELESLGLIDRSDYL